MKPYKNVVFDMVYIHKLCAPHFQWRFYNYWRIITLSFNFSSTIEYLSYILLIRERAEKFVQFKHRRFFLQKKLLCEEDLKGCENANEHFRLEMKLDKTHFSPKRFGIFLTMVDVNLALTVELGYSTKILLEC